MSDDAFVLITRIYDIKNTNHEKEDEFTVITAYYSYKRRLTRPPCNEQVNWFILKESITISEEVVNFLKNNMPLDNYRKEQALKGRKVYSVLLNDNFK